MAKKKRMQIAIGLFLFLVIAVFGVIGYVAMHTAAVNYGDADPPMNDPTDLNGYGGSSIQLWQALYVTPINGNPYWAAPPAPFNPASIFGSNGDNFLEVSQLQNSVYINTPDGANTVSLTCKETIIVTDEQGNTKATIIQSKQFTGDAFGKSALAGQNTPVSGATVTGPELQSIINLPAGNYNFIVKLSDIQLTLDGNTYTANVGTAENVLTWPIQIT